MLVPSDRRLLNRVRMIHLLALSALGIGLKRSNSLQQISRKVLIFGGGEGPNHYNQVRSLPPFPRQLYVPCARSLAPHRSMLTNPPPALLHGPLILGYKQVVLVGDRLS